MRIDLPLCLYKECSRICKHYLGDGNCSLKNINAEGAIPPCEKVIQEIIDTWILEQDWSEKEVNTDE